MLQNLYLVKAKNNWCWETDVSCQNVYKHRADSECKDCETVQESSVMSKLMRSVNLNVENYLRYVSVKGILVKD